MNGKDIYASVMIREGTEIKNRSNTPIVFSVYKNPIWDHAIRFSLHEPGRLTRFVQLISHRIVRGDKEIGEVKSAVYVN
ncbi:unnamed protein product [Arabis nemorensis]|uniref:C2 domain-containing protein n=1 Tax=Arabis nemorensis TaxID=586526 RepID=A0A565BH87_9BRAS|nr:unnamed protein product [Arabis nemorensis]